MDDSMKIMSHESMCVKSIILDNSATNINELMFKLARRNSASHFKFM